MQMVAKPVPATVFPELQAALKAGLWTLSESTPMEDVQFLIDALYPGV